MPVPHLKRQLDSARHHAAAARTVDTGTAAQSARDVAEVVVRHVGLRIAELRLVQYVQGIGAELQFIPLANPDSPNDGDIEAEKAGPTENVAAHAAPHLSDGCSKAAFA